MRRQAPPAASEQQPFGGKGVCGPSFPLVFFGGVICFKEYYDPAVSSKVFVRRMFVIFRITDHKIAKLFLAR
jgi:hypothetical protein